MLLRDLPSDQFNVVIENDVDKARLLWLANKIGETKLRKSVAKYQARWPESKPFVSTLLRWYQLKVPVAVYAPVRVPVYWLYLLYKHDGSEVKVGITGDWPRRVYSLVPLHKKVSDYFDLDRSSAFLVGGRKDEVLRREAAIKVAFANSRSRPKDSWNSGYTEWFTGDRFGELVQMASLFDHEKNLYQQTLGEAIQVHGLQTLTGCA